MRLIERLATCSVSVVLLLVLIVGWGRAQGTNATPSAAFQPRIRITIPAVAGKQLSIQSDSVSGTQEELRAVGNVLINFPCGFRLQASHVLVRINPAKGDGEKTITVEPLPTPQSKQ
jgi:hypothetical protein